MQDSAQFSENQLASVIIPTYNRGDFIVQTLDSVLEQTYRPIEVLVVDDGSTDDTEKVVKEWRKEHQTDVFIIKYLHQDNAGAPTARNTGMDHATGRYLQFLDSDDLLLPGKLKAQISLMQKENTEVCICDYLVVNEHGKKLNRASNDRSHFRIISDFRFIQTSFCVIDKTCFDRHILRWNTHLKRGQDQDFNTKAFLLVRSFSYVNDVLYKWVKHSNESITKGSYNRKLHREVLASILDFHVKNRKQIPFKRIFAATVLYIKLWYMSSLIKTIVRYIRTGGGEKYK